MNKSILPESVQIGKHYSFWADMKLNAWAIVATLVAAASRILLHGHPDWAVPLRAAVALAPMIPSLLYVRSCARWIGGMDELQRGIQLQACLFATIATLFVTGSVNLLGMAGVLEATRLQKGLGWEGMFALVIFFYILGNVIVNRRYR